MRWLAGTAAPFRLTRWAGLDACRALLIEQIGREIARLHRIRPPSADPAFLGSVPRNPVVDWLEGIATAIDQLPETRPVLCHGDYLLGNVMIQRPEFAGVLDWDFAGWSDPMEDIGWICARCWRYGMDACESGGLGNRADLYRGYEADLGQYAACGR